MTSSLIIPTCTSWKRHRHDCTRFGRGSRDSRIHPNISRSRCCVCGRCVARTSSEPSSFRRGPARRRHAVKPSCHFPFDRDPFDLPADYHRSSWTEHRDGDGRHLHRPPVSLCRRCRLCRRAVAVARGPSRVAIAPRRRMLRKVRVGFSSFWIVLVFRKGNGSRENGTLSAGPDTASPGDSYLPSKANSVPPQAWIPIRPSSIQRLALRLTSTDLSRRFPCRLRLHQAGPLKGSETT
jgi:hypothetical protein